MKKAVCYSIVVCLVTWVLYYLAVDLMGFEIAASPVSLFITKSVYMLMPALVALVFQWFTHDFSSNKLLNFNISYLWAVGILVIVFVVMMACPISTILPGISFHYGPDQLMAMRNMDEETAVLFEQGIANVPKYAVIGGTVIAGMIGGCTLKALLSLGEEYGWHNYLVSLLSGRKFFFVALFTGFVWGIWHMPVVLDGVWYPQHPQMGVAMMCIICLLAGTLNLYFLLKTRSVILVAMMHGTIDGISGLVLLMTDGGSDLTNGVTGLGGILTTSIVLIGVYVYDTYVSKERIMSSPIEI